MAPPDGAYAKNRFEMAESYPTEMDLMQEIDELEHKHLSAPEVDKRLDDIFRGIKSRKMNDQLTAVFGFHELVLNPNRLIGPAEMREIRKHITGLPSPEWDFVVGVLLQRLKDPSRMPEDVEVFGELARWRDIGARKGEVVAELQKIETNSRRPEMVMAAGDALARLSGMESQKSFGGKSSVDSVFRGMRKEPGKTDIIAQNGRIERGMLRA